MKTLPAASLHPWTVPTWATGAWRRTLLEWDDGEDRSTDVLYLQTPVLFADIRIASRRDQESEGFAGHATVNGQICRWHRPIDVKPKDGDGDVGVMYRRGDRMIECGVHRNYLEDWRLVGDTGQHFAASRGAVSIDKEGIHWPSDGPLEIVVAVGERVIHAWRSPAGSGVVAGRLDSSGSWLAEKTVGNSQRNPAPGDWTIWSAQLGSGAAERLLMGL